MQKLEQAKNEEFSTATPALTALSIEDNYTHKGRMKVPRVQ